MDQVDQEGDPMEIDDKTLRIPEIRHRSKPLALWILAIMLIGGVPAFFCDPCFGQEEQQVKEPPNGMQTAAQADQSTKPAQPDAQPKKKEKKPSRGSFVAVPIPMSSPAVGSGLVPAVGYIFPFSMKDKISPPSVVGGGALITNNGSRFYAFAGQLYIKENRYRITAAFGRGNINYDIYGTGRADGFRLPLKQTGQIFFGEFLRRVGWKIFVGPQFISGKSTITLKRSEDSQVPIPEDLGLHTTLVALGLKVYRDTVPNRFYPTEGASFNFTSDFYAKGLGSKYSFQSYKATFNKYWSLDKKQVLAYNAYGCGTGGSPPFYANCIYGTSNELRGYTAGQYFTRYMLATQLEYRLTLPWRLGLVGFGGLGEAIPGESQLYGKRKFLPATGAGLRFLLSKEYHVNFAVTYGIGRDGHTFGMGIGEAF
jgi:hypothetical protein